jgi:ATP-dependent Clp protease ATP-binding subunit ClpA
MEQHLRRRVIGQEEAVAAVSEAVRRARSGLKDPRRPIGSFIFTGPTGVGKTELARALAEFLFQDEEAMLRFDMSEYMDKASASRLLGAPPGYAGYDDAGQLTEAVRRKPYSVVLFDEIEKAHPDIFNVLLQLLDDGRLTDTKGRTADFKNTVIILTSNLGAPAADEEPMPWEQLRARMLGALREEFRPEFLNRIDETIVFHPLGQEELRRVVAIMLDQTARKLHAQHMGLAFSEAATEAVAAAGYDPAYGARPLRRAIQREIENPLARRLLHGEFQAGDAILVDHGPDGFTFSPRSSNIAK